MNIGDQAFEIVQKFSALGPHRTGTKGQRDTFHWLASVLLTSGAEVSYQSFPLLYYAAEVCVRSEGKSVKAIALYYSFTGKKNLRNYATGSIDAHADEAAISQRINGMVDQSKTDGCDGLVLATLCPTGDLCAINRECATDLGFPVILVEQNHLNAIQTNDADIFFSASVRKTLAQNVIARFPGPIGARRITITTPISGWFQCAGERGCGLAVAILVARQLSASFAVDLLLANGHELGFLGGHHLAGSYAAGSQCLLHLGSCIANIDAQMTSICSADPPTIERITASLGRLGIKPTVPVQAADGNNWVGESMCWAANGLPMLSIAGQAPHFHTSGDLPNIVTAPNLLADSIDAVHNSALDLVHH